MSEVLYFLFIGALFYAMMRWGCGAHMMGGHGGHAGGQGDYRSGSEEKKGLPVLDPVCGRELDANTVEFSEPYRGGLYYFCSDKCRGQFKRDPGQYTKGV